MGQSASTTSSSSSSSRHKQPPPPPLPMDSAMAPAVDHTTDLPDELLALVFHFLGSGDRKRCSLVCRRWLAVEGFTRSRLALDARAALSAAVPGVFARFPAVSKLSLKCDRRADSIGDDTLGLLARGFPGLTRLKLRACRAVTDSGMAALASACPGIRKLSVGCCAFGSKGVDAVLRGCPNLEELSLKRLRGIPDAAAAADPVGPSAAAVAGSSLRSVCLKELYNAQCFAPLISASPNLKVLKLFRCSGDWDPLLEEIAAGVPGLTEIHLEKLQVGDRGLAALASCSRLEVIHLVKTPECTNAGLAAIAERCHLLRKIHIDGCKTNRIGDHGLIVIARKCPNLQELVLIGVNPTALSLDMIASNCPNLERLALCGSETVGDAEISCIAAKCLALRKLCIKGCPVSNHGMEALADGCPKLVKVKVKKCRGVTPECAAWLRVTRGALSVNFDAPGSGELLDPSVAESGAAELAELDDVTESVEVPSSSNGRPSPWKARMGVRVGSIFFASAFRRWSHGNNYPRNS